MRGNAHDKLRLQRRKVLIIQARRTTNNWFFQKRLMSPFFIAMFPYFSILSYFCHLRESWNSKSLYYMHKRTLCSPHKFENIFTPATFLLLCIGVFSCMHREIPQVLCSSTVTNVMQPGHGDRQHIWKNLVSLLNDLFQKFTHRCFQKTSEMSQSDLVFNVFTFELSAYPTDFNWSVGYCGNWFQWTTINYHPIKCKIIYFLHELFLFILP